VISGEGRISLLPWTDSQPLSPRRVLVSPGRGALTGIPPLHVVCRKPLSLRLYVTRTRIHDESIEYDTGLFLSRSSASHASCRRTGDADEGGPCIRVTGETDIGWKTAGWG